MSGKQYLKNQLAVILINLLGMLALALFLIASGNNIQTVLFILVVWLLVLASCLLFFFFTRKKALDRLLNMAEQLEERYLLPEIMQEPERADEQVFYQIMKMAEKSMLEQIGDLLDAIIRIERVAVARIADLGGHHAADDLPFAVDDGLSVRLLLNRRGDGIQKADKCHALSSLQMSIPDFFENVLHHGASVSFRFVHPVRPHPQLGQLACGICFAPRLPTCRSTLFGFCTVAGAIVQQKRLFRIANAFSVFPSRINANSPHIICITFRRFIRSDGFDHVARFPISVSFRRFLPCPLDFFRPGQQHFICNLARRFAHPRHFRGNLVDAVRRKLRHVTPRRR